MPVCGGFDAGGWDEPFAGTDCTPDVPAGPPVLPGLEVIGCEAPGLLCAAPETPPVEPGAVPMADPGAPAPLPIELPLTTNSTRRFCWRPAAVAFVATGLDSPNPFVVTASVLTP